MIDERPRYIPLRGQPFTLFGGRLRLSRTQPRRMTASNGKKRTAEVLSLVSTLRPPGRQRKMLPQT
jgi:hypothetical protein